MLYMRSLSDTRPYAPGMELVVCFRCGRGAAGHDRGVRNWDNCIAKRSVNTDYTYAREAARRESDAMREVTR